MLEYLGVPIINDPAAAKKSLIKPGFAFLFAPAYHPAMKHVAPVRKELGFRTMFNLLGPLCNPAGVRRQLMGIFAEEWLEPVAHVLAELGAEKAWVVHGADGLDEMSTTGITRVAVLEKGRVSLREIAPEDAGLKRSNLSALKGGTAEGIRFLVNCCHVAPNFVGFSRVKKERDATGPISTPAAASRLVDKSGE